MPIIASTGLYYFPSCLTNSRSAEELSEIFLEECRVGMEGTGILPGILKCAIEEAEMSADCTRRIGALGITQHATGLPLYAHCRFAGNSADSLLDTLLKYGADPHRVVLGLASSRPDADYLEHILQRGCFISIDQCFSDRLNICAETVGELCRRGYSKQLLFSLDRPIYNDFATNATTGLHAPEEEHISRYGFLFTDMYPAFRKAGCTEEDIHQMMIENPANLLDL